MKLVIQTDSGDLYTVVTDIEERNVTEPNEGMAILGGIQDLVHVLTYDHSDL